MTLPPSLLADIARDMEDFESRSLSQPFTRRVLTAEFLPRIVLIMFVSSQIHLPRLLVAIQEISLLGQFAAFMVGAYMADLFSGSVHCFLDHVKLEAVPAQKRNWLQYLAFGFQYHHVQPINWLYQDLFAHGILKAGFILFLLAHIVWFLFQVFSPSHWTDLMFIVLSWSLLLCQVAHAAAHNRFRDSFFWSRFFAFAQSVGLLISPSQHHIHHSRFDQNFCIINGWANPLLNKIFMLNTIQGLIEPEMLAVQQQRVYLQERANLVWPYYNMFPDLRQQMN